MASYVVKADIFLEDTMPEINKIFINNTVLDASVIAWALASLIKVVITLITHKKIDFKRFIGTGGMPSSHSAAICSMSASVFRVCGISSPEFAISAVLAVIVMYDAAGVRRAAGEQAKILNKMASLWENHGADRGMLMEKHLKELLGHTPIQVFAGSLLGIGVAFIYYSQLT